jgi:hypothetical protein
MALSEKRPRIVLGVVAGIDILKRKILSLRE